MSRMVVATFVTLATLAGALLLWSLRGAALLLLLAIATAAALRPLVERLSARMPRALALAITYAALVAVGFNVVWTLAGPLVDEIGRAATHLSGAYEAARARWPHGGSFEGALARALLPSLDRIRTTASREALLVAQGAFGVTRTLVEIVARGALVLALSVYWSASGERVDALWLSLLEPGRRARVRALWHDLERSVGRALRRETVQSLLALFALGVAFRALDLEFWALAAVSAAVLRLVPIVGPILALGAVTAIALPDGGGLSAIAAGVTVVCLATLSVTLRVRPLPPRGSAVLAVVTVLVLADAWGIPGMLLAVPLAAALQVVLARLPRIDAQHVRTGDLGELEARYRRLRRAVRAGDPPPELASLLERLGRLLRRARRATSEAERRSGAR